MKVTIYERPLTMECLEGQAELVERLTAADPETGMERWRVRFDGDDQVVERYLLDIQRGTPPVTPRRRT